MDPAPIAQRYFEAWNNRDAAAIAATFAQGGTYADPATPGPLTGEAIGAYAQNLWSMFPDLSFEIRSVTQGDSGLISAEWLMKGTNSGSFNGLPPTGRYVELAGADFIRVEGEKIRSVQGYFDSGEIPRALGLDIIVQPKRVGPVELGSSVRASSGSKAIPGAFSITCLEARNAEERQAVTDSSRKVVVEMMAMPGFISWVGVTIGDRMMTLTAWETPEAMEPLMKTGEHRSAVGRFMGPEIARGGITGVWTPHRLNPRRTRCAACSRMADAAAETCACGATLPEPIAYW